MTKKDLNDATRLAVYAEGLHRATLEGTPDPIHTGWQDRIRRMLRGTFDSQCSAMVAGWAEAWKSYEIPQPLVSGLQFPKWRDEKMEEQEKQKQKETDRYFAWLGAKHALRVVKTELDAADARLTAARLRLEEAKQETRTADDLCAKAVRAVEAARSVVALLEPKKS